MNEFMKRYELVISTLSPVHIGCGEDYEPTNYVMDDDCLYPFHAISESAFPSKQQRDALLKQCNSIQGLWNIFHSAVHLETMKALAERYVPMKPGIQAQQAQRINDSKFPLIIERTAFDRFSGAPILPGSGIKGAIRTAILERQARESNFPGAEQVRNKKEHQDIQKNLMKGSFASDPLRLLKISDAHLAGTASPEPTRILTRHSRHRKDNTKTSVSDSGQNFSECIVPFMAGAFRAEFTLLQNSHTWEERDRKITVKNLAIGNILKACNDYYLDRLKAHREALQILNAGKWFDSILPLVEQAVRESRGFLLRVGKHAGADYLTIEKYRRIQTKYEKYPTAKTLPISTTLCGDGKEYSPFGWMFVEVCEPGQRLASPLQEGLRELAGRNADPETKAKQERFALQRVASREKLVANQAEFAAKAAHEAAQAAATQAAAERLATLSPALREVEVFVAAARLRSEQLRGAKENLNTEFHNRARKLAATALENAEWTAEEKRAAADAIAEWLPQLVKGIDKDQLKKLKLGALRGTA